MNDLKGKIKQICPEDIYEVGYASLSGLLRSDLIKYKYGISLVRKLDDSIIDQIASGPIKEYYNLYQEVNNELNAKVNDICDILKSNNIDSYPIKATVEDSELDEEYAKTLRYFFSHKMVATQSGIGWIGKTDLLISKKYGPRVRLASVLTTTYISDIGIPINESQCGKCNICVENCPAGAATGQLWSIKIDRNEFYNPFKCREFSRKVSNINLNKKISLCGICVSVCPKGKK